MSDIPREKILRWRDLCKNNLKFLGKECLGFAEWSKVHDEMMASLRQPYQRQLYLIPRGHLKSSVVTKAWSIQQVLINPDIRILIANAVWDNARKFLRSIQRYVGPASVLETLFGTFQSENWNQDECIVRMRKKILDAPTWATTGIEKEQTSQHYDLIIADDLVARDNCSTSDQRRKVKLYYKDLLDLLEPTGKLVVIGTRWHQDDLYADLQQDNNFHTFVKTAYTDESRTSVLFPEKFSLDYLNELRKAKGAYEFSAQYLNNPLDEEASDFKPSWIHYYDPTTPHPINLYLTVDPALSLSRDADPSALVVAGMFSNRRIRVVDRVRGKFMPSDLVDQVFKLVAKWNLHRIGIETFAFQKTLKYEIQRQQRERQSYFTIDEFSQNRRSGNEPGSIKEARIRRLQPYFEQGLIELRSDMQDLEQELLSFPRGKHDDLIDALSMQLDYLYPSSQQSVEEVATKAVSRPMLMRDLVKATLKNKSVNLMDRVLEDLQRAPQLPKMV